MKLSNSKLILIILTILSILMIGVTTVRDEWLSPLRTTVGWFLMPVQSGVNTIGKSLYNNIKDREKMQTALEDNKKLREEINSLKMENTRLQQDTFELRRLRSLFELSRTYGQYRMVGARVIAKDAGGWFSVFRINKGYDDGIRVDMNVLAGSGLAGIVTDVGANYATVRAVIDDVSRVSASAVESGETCIVSGDLRLYEDGVLRISDIRDTSDIKPGDKIVTSQVSAKYLPGLLIGYVKELDADPARLTKSGTLIPAADFGTLQEVLVVMELKSELNERTEIDTLPEASETDETPSDETPSDETAPEKTASGEASPDGDGPVSSEPSESSSQAESGSETETESVISISIDTEE